MARLINSGTTEKIFSAVSKKNLTVFELVYVDIDGGIFMTNAPFNVTISDAPNGTRNGTYASVGRFLGFSEIKEEQQFTISEITATLSGLPAYDQNNDSIIADLLQGDYIDKRAEIARVFYDSDYNYLSAILVFKGRISAPVIQDDPAETTTVAITAANNWIDYQRTNGMVTTDNRQTAIYSGDRGMQYAKDVVKDIKWQAPQS